MRARASEGAGRLVPAAGRSAARLSSVARSRNARNPSLWRWLRPLKSSPPLFEQNYEANLTCPCAIVCSELNTTAQKSAASGLGLRLLTSGGGKRRTGAWSGKPKPENRSPRPELQSCRTTLNSELWTKISPLYSIKPSFRKRFMKKLTRERVVPIISASVS